MAKRNNTLKLKFDNARKLAPAPESRSSATIDARYNLFIDGKFTPPASKKYFATTNPATDEKLSEVADANAADVEQMLAALRQGGVTPEDVEIRRADLEDVFIRVMNEDVKKTGGAA